MNNAQMREVCRDICGILGIHSGYWTMVTGFVDGHVNLMISENWGNGLARWQLDKLTNYFDKYFAGVINIGHGGWTFGIVLNRPE